MSKSRYKHVYQEVEVEVDLSEWDDDELIEELERRGTELSEYTSSEEIKSIIEKIWLLRRTNQSYDHLMDSLIAHALNRIL